MKIVDVNILLFAVQGDSPLHAKVGAWWASNLAGEDVIGLAWSTLLGFVRISTNPKVFTSPSTVSEAINHVDSWLGHPNTRLVVESDDHWSQVSGLLKQVGTAANLTTGAHLAALAISHDATLVSCDTDFAKFSGVKWENPAAD